MVSEHCKHVSFSELWVFILARIPLAHSHCIRYYIVPRVFHHTHSHDYIYPQFLIFEYLWLMHMSSSDQHLIGATQTGDGCAEDCGTTVDPNEKP